MTATTRPGALYVYGQRHLVMPSTQIMLPIGEALDAALAQAAQPKQKKSRETAASPQPAEAKTPPPTLQPPKAPLLPAIPTQGPRSEDREKPQGPGPGDPLVTVSSWLAYEHGRYILLRGQVIPFCDMNGTKYDPGIAHVLSICRTRGLMPDASYTTDVCGETSSNWADGVFGFSGSKFFSRPGLYAPDLMNWAGWGDSTESLFPTFWLKAEDHSDGPALSKINPLTQEVGNYVEVAQEYVQPFCAAQAAKLANDEHNALQVGMVSKFSHCQIFIGFGTGPRELSWPPGYRQFLKQPRFLKDVLAHRDRFEMLTPTFKTEDSGDRTDRKWPSEIRRQLNAGAHDMRSRLTSCGVLT